MRRFLNAGPISLPYDVRAHDCPVGGSTKRGRRPAHSSWRSNLHGTLPTSTTTLPPVSPASGRSGRTSRRSELRPEIQALRALAVLSGAPLPPVAEQALGWVCRRRCLLRDQRLPHHLAPALRGPSHGQAPPRPLLGAPCQAAAARVAARAVHHRSGRRRARAGRPLAAVPHRGVGIGPLRPELAPGLEQRRLPGRIGNIPSPVQHFWTLSVEEQFYVMVPLLLLGAACIARRAAGSGADRSARDGCRRDRALLRLQHLADGDGSARVVLLDLLPGVGVRGSVH